MIQKLYYILRCECSQYQRKIRNSNYSLRCCYILRFNILPKHRINVKYRKQHTPTSQRTKKPSIRLVRAAKPQVSLGICAVWSESSLIVCALYSLQDHLSLCWSHRPYCNFCLAVAQMKRERPKEEELHK